MRREYFSHFNIAGFTYNEGCFCFGALQIGTTVTLRLDAENKYDPQAVAIYYNEFKLGYVPRNQNSDIHKLLKVGFTGFECKVQRVDPSEHTEQQIQVVVFVVGGGA